MSIQSIASRTLTTDHGDIIVRIGVPSQPDVEAAAFEYTIVDTSGKMLDSLTVYGADSVQALLFCLTAVGDYLKRFEPSASFADLGVTGFPVTDLNAVNLWSATVALPTS